MKALGIGTAGIAAASAAVPVIHDLDELLQEGEKAKFTAQKRPWWVKERKYLDPTTNIDWNLMQRYNRCYESQTTFTMTRYVPQSTRDQWNDEGARRTTERQQGNGPGYDVRWRALSAARGAGNMSGWNNDYGGPFTDTLPTHAKAWNGNNAEENSKLLNAAMRYFGANWVGFQPLDDKWRKMIVEATTAGATSQYQPGSYTDVPENVQHRFVYDNNATTPRMETIAGATGRRYYIPTQKQQYIIVYSTACSAELMKCVESTVHTPNSTVNSNHHTDVNVRVNTFLRALGCGAYAYGYVGHQQSETNYSGAAIFSGIAEYSRQSLYSITPETGASHNPCNILTPFPLEPTNPIDAGIWKFCQVCGKCAETCPSKSIQPKSDGKPTYTFPKQKRVDGVEEEVTWHKRGVESYYVNYLTCQQHRNSAGQSCSYCYSNCVFTEDKAAMIHNMVRATVSHTSLFNSFFASMSDPFGFGSYENADIWWDMTLPAFGIDTTIGSSKGAY